MVALDLFRDIFYCSSKIYIVINNYANLYTQITQKLHRKQKNFLVSIFSTLFKKMKFFVKDFFSKCDQIRRKLRIWSHLLRKSLMENFIFRAVPAARWQGLLV